MAYRIGGRFSYVSCIMHGHCTDSNCSHTTLTDHVRYHKALTDPQPHISENTQPNLPLLSQNLIQSSTQRYCDAAVNVEYPLELRFEGLTSILVPGQWARWHIKSKLTTNSRRVGSNSGLAKSIRSNNSTAWWKRFAIFTARSSYANAVLGIVILPVCQLHACFVTKWKNILPIFWHHVKWWSLEFSDTNRDWWMTSPSTKNLRLVTHPIRKTRLRPISAYNVSTVRSSEKS